MKNILVLGANGMLGGEAVDYFNGLPGYSAKGLSRHPLFGFQEVIKGQLRIGAYDWCVNCAAMTDTAGAENDPAKRMASLEANVMLPAELARICRECGVRFMHFSTDYAFGGPRRASGLIPDTEKPAPISVYGTHKAAGENEALAQNPGATVVLRTSWLYGRRNEKSFVHRFSAALAKALIAGEALDLPDDEYSLPTSTKTLLGMAALAIDRDLRGVLHAVSLPRGGLLPYSQVPSRLRWAQEIGNKMWAGWRKRKDKGETAPAEDAVWGKYDKFLSIAGKPGGKTDEWRPSYSAMLVSESLRGVSKDWTEDLDGFFLDGGYGAEWSRKICGEAAEAAGRRA